jgi:hypothetical protein
MCSLILLHVVVIAGICSTLAELGAFINFRHFGRWRRFKLDSGWIYIRLKIVYLIYLNIVSHGIYEHLRFIITTITFIIYLWEIQGFSPLTINLWIVPCRRLWIIIDIWITLRLYFEMILFANEVSSCDIILFSISRSNNIWLGI